MVVAMTEMGRQRASEQGAWAGAVGPVVFVTVFTIEGWLRPGYEPTSMFVSALSIGPRGWIQIVNFIFVGLAFVLLARAAALQFPTGPASRAGPLLLLIVGLALLASGPCVMDPPDVPFPAMSASGKAHSLLGALVFSLGPASCFVFFRRFRSDVRWRLLRWWTLAAGVISSIAVVLLKVATLPPPATPSALNDWAGLIQRVALVTFMAWVASFGWALQRRLSASASVRSAASARPSG